MSEVADALVCDWHTVNDAVVAYGEALIDADEDRIPTVRALSLDETLFMGEGRGGPSGGRPSWSTLAPGNSSMLFWAVIQRLPAVCLADRDPE